MTKLTQTQKDALYFLEETEGKRNLLLPGYGRYRVSLRALVHRGEGLVERNATSEGEYFHLTTVGQAVLLSLDADMARQHKRKQEKESVLSLEKYLGVFVSTVTLHLHGSKVSIIWGLMSGDYQITVDWRGQSRVHVVSGIDPIVHPVQTANIAAWKIINYCRDRVSGEEQD